MMENKLVSGRKLNKSSQHSFATESAWEQARTGQPFQRLKNDNSHSKDVQNFVDYAPNYRYQQATPSSFSRLREGSGRNHKLNKPPVPNFSQIPETYSQNIGSGYTYSNQNIPKNSKYNRSKSGFKGFQGNNPSIGERSRRKIEESNMRNLSQPVGSFFEERRINRDNKFASMDYDQVFGKSKSRVKNGDNRPVKGMSQEMILSNYYPITSIDKKKKKYSTVDRSKNFPGSNLNKAKNKWRVPQEILERPIKKDKKRAPSINQPIQIIQQISINQIKKNTINIHQYGKKFPKKSRPKFGMKKQSSVPQRKVGKSRPLPKKPNTNDPYKDHPKNAIKNLKYKTNRLKLAHQKKNNTSGINKNKSIMNEKKKSYRLKHYGKASQLENNLKKRKERDKNFGRIKSATTNLNRKKDNGGLGKSGYIKKKEVIGGKKNQGKREYKNSYLRDKKTDQSYSQAHRKLGRSRVGKTPPIIKGSSIMKKTAPVNQIKHETKNEAKRPFSLYQSKYGKSNAVKAKPFGVEKKSNKRYFFKSHKTKEKQIKRETRLKEEMRKINEQTNQKKDEKKVAQIGYNFLQKKARGSAGAKELLNIVQKNKRKIKRKSKGGIKIEIQTTFPRNKLNHFRDSLKKDKKNNTLSPRNLQRNAQMGSETSGELIQMSTGDDFISSKMKKAISRIQNTSRAGSFEQSKKLQERRNKKFFEKNRIKSLNHQKANKEVKLALELVEGNLKEIETIRKSGLREKTARSLSKKMQKLGFRIEASPKREEKKLNQKINKEKEKSKEILKKIKDKKIEIKKKEVAQTKVEVVQIKKEITQKKVEVVQTKKDNWEVKKASEIKENLNEKIENNKVNILSDSPEKKIKTQEYQVKKIIKIEIQKPVIKKEAENITQSIKKGISEIFLIKRKRKKIEEFWKLFKFSQKEA